MAFAEKVMYLATLKVSEEGDNGICYSGLPKVLVRVEAVKAV